MNEGQRVIEICADFNDNPPQVVIRDAFDAIDIQVAIMDGNLTVDQRLEKYRGQLSDKTFQMLGEMLREKMKASLWAKVKEMQGEARG